MVSVVVVDDVVGAYVEVAVEYSRNTLGLPHVCPQITHIYPHFTHNYPQLPTITHRFL